MKPRFLKLVVLVIWHYLKRNVIWFGLGMIILGIIIIFQSRFNFFYSPNALRIGLIGTFQEHDLPDEVTGLISEGLVEADETGMIKPVLISGWEVNSDATEFKFKLKDNIKWADSSPVKSADLEFAIPNVSVSYPDDKTIQFKLKEAYSPFPSLLTKTLIKKSTSLGTGPYRIKSVEKSRIFITKITLEPIPSWNDKLPNIDVRFYPSEKIAQTGFDLGEVEVLGGVSNTKFDSNLIGTRQKIDYSKIITILYHANDSLVGGKNRSLRQALSFITLPIRSEEIADNPYPKTSWAYDKSAKKYLGNKKEAESALERAKTQMGDNQLKAEIILTATPNLAEVGKKVVQGWKSLGFDAKLRVESGIPQNFQALLITQSIPTDPDQYFLWHATQTKTNLSRFDSKRVDKDLEDGRKIINQDERQEKYFDFQKTLLEEAPATFLYFPKYNLVYLKKKEKQFNQILSLWKF
ncbi:hypothetical protein HY384_00525 [Candidatus Daviesbacteria bacterium]|nr:hypothetical protein [Candidatus Daviesbacteria bacterium]